MITPDKLWYSQHFVHYRQLFRSTTTQAVLEYIVDEYTRFSKSADESVRCFEITPNDITVKTGVCFETVINQLKVLDRSKIIRLSVIDGPKTKYRCIFNEQVFLSLLCASTEQKTAKNIKAFACALEGGEWSVLKEMGYELHPEYKDMMRKLSGSPISTQKSDEVIRNLNISSDFLEHTHFSDNVLRNLNMLSENLEHYQISDNFFSRLDRITNEMAYEICNSFTKDELISQISDSFSTNFTSKDGFLAFIDDLYAGERITFSPLIFCLHGIIRNLITDIQKSDNVRAKSSQISESLNKYNNKENKYGDAEGIPNKGVKESDDLNEEVVDEIPSEEIKRMDMGNYSQKKLKSQLPFYTSQEIQEILNNPQEAISSNDKLFIRVLWNVAKEQASVDQDDQEVEVDVEGYKFPADRFQRDILSPALEETNEIIEAGMLRTEVENLPVELEELQPEQVELIIDWETGRDSVGPFIVGSASRFHKIYSEPVEEPRRRRGRNSRNTEEREKAKEYFRNLLRCDDDGYDKLSQIEKAVFNFANEFLEVDWASGEVTGLADSEDLKEKFISPDHYTGFLAMLREDIGLNITREDFESVLNQAEPQPTGALDHIGETMFSIFSYEKIQAWIKKHSN